jgi:hypothetical protein
MSERKKLDLDWIMKILNLSLMNYVTIWLIALNKT